MDGVTDPRARLEAYARQNLPRYTSYPTAPHFTPLTEAEYRGWLAAIRPGDALSLYLHIPFCRKLCWYCGCHTAITRNTARLARYAEGLAREAALIAAALPPGAPVTALHLGGGTPSAIGARGLGQVMQALREAFDLPGDAELAVECDPRELGDDVIALLAREGFRRASLGVQDMDPGVQARIGRVQPAELVQDAVRRLRGAGFEGVNFDLMYGLPGQGVAHVEASARFAIAMGADRIAVFGYAHVPWMKPHQKAIDTAALPGAMARMEQAEAAARVLTAAAYVPIGFDHFALPDDAMARAQRAGVLRRNFQGYTTDRAPILLGLGASAIGAPMQGYVQNLADERAWLHAVEAGRLPVARGLALTEDDRIRRAIIETVMCDLELDLLRVPLPIWREAAPRLAPLQADGLVAMDRGRLLVTGTGRRFLRHVAACFDAKLGAARHSAAV